VTEIASGQTVWLKQFPEICFGVLSPTLLRVPLWKNQKVKQVSKVMVAIDVQTRLLYTVQLGILRLKLTIY